MGGCFSGFSASGRGALKARQLPEEVIADPSQAFSVPSASAPPLDARQASAGGGAPMLAPGGPSVATIVVPGDEDIRKLISTHCLEVNWKRDDQVVKTSLLVEKPMRRRPQPEFALPTLYLHFLERAFLPDADEVDWALRCGNDNDAVNIVLPQMYTRPWYTSGKRVEGQLGQDLALVVKFLQSVGESVVAAPQTKPGGWASTNYSVDAASARHWFALKTARPKASISLDRAAFGIPLTADMYVFAQNHSSVDFLDERHRQAFDSCIAKLPSMAADLANLGSFLKIFYEGGFAYNKKIVLSGGYIPKTVGVACMSVVPAFDGQLGIKTGDPYLVDSRFMPFVDTVPVTIQAISDMSSRHHRYGLCFTRGIHVWESENFESSQVLHYALLCPHGGFYYTPASLGEYWRDGCLVYAFGEDRSQHSSQDVPIMSAQGL